MTVTSDSFFSVYCSYSIMRKCWNDDKESRPTFLELTEEFDDLISQEERYNYLILDNVKLTSEGPAVAGESPTSPHSLNQAAEAATEEPVV